MLMPRKRPPFVEVWRDRHGKVRVYFRKERGPRLPLPDSIGSDEFNVAYHAALTGQIDPPRQRHVRAAPGTIGALIISYMQSAAYRGLRETSKTGYRSRIEMLRTQHGHRSIEGLSRERIITGILQPYADRPGAALATLKMLRVLIRHSIDIGWLKYDPSLGIKRPKTQEIRSWTDAEIEAFETRWTTGTKQRLAFALMLYTGQRRSDVHRMTWADVSGPTIRVVQQKTRRKLVIPLHHALRKVLAATEREHVTIINTEYGKPYTVDGFSQWMRDAITAAGLPLDCQPHGLRKAAGRRLAEAGCSANEIMSVLGHQTLAEAERYTRDADQVQLATGAFAKLEGHKRNRVAQTTPHSLGEAAKTKGETK
jgi:enterobacteria phage integrase